MGFRVGPEGHGFGSGPGSSSLLAGRHYSGPLKHHGLRGKSNLVFIID